MPRAGIRRLIGGFMATSRAVVSMGLYLALLALPATVHAMEIRQFDKLDGDDQIDFVDQLAESVQAAATGPLAAKVRYFFEPKHPGEEISGMGRFELNLALARIADLDAAEKNPGIRRLEVEDVMYTTLESAGIVLGQNFRPSAVRFHPRRPPANFVMDKVHARRALTETQDWIAAQNRIPERQLTDGEKAIAFFAALMAVGTVLDRAGVRLSGGGVDSGAPRTWWEQSGYQTYHDAVRATCLQNTTAAFPTWCN
jgi:hypothetical protein